MTLYWNTVFLIITLMVWLHLTCCSAETMSPSTNNTFEHPCSLSTRIRHLVVIKVFSVTETSNNVLFIICLLRDILVTKCQNDLRYWILATDTDVSHGMNPYVLGRSTGTTPSTNISTSKHDTANTQLIGWQPFTVPREWTLFKSD